MDYHFVSVDIQPICIFWFILHGKKFDNSIFYHGIYVLNAFILLYCLLKLLFENFLEEMAHATDTF